jgi:lysophospholipase L1-like esterase
MKPRFSGLKVRLAGLTTLIILTIVLSSCGDFKKSSVVTPPSNGSLSFASFVSIGNSLTAGYQNGALYESAQIYSFPALIAKQVGVSSSFQQPLIADPGIGKRMYLTNLATGASTTYLVQGQPLNSALPRPYNNLGVPGAVLGDLLYTTDFAAQANPAGRANPFFEVVLRTNALGNNMVEQALALQPTFITVWIGANDVLGYATTGGTSGTGGVGTGPTDVATFTQLYIQMMDSLMIGAPKAKFAIANIPDVTTIPFFTTVPDSFANPQTGKNIGPYIVVRHHVDGTPYADFINAKSDYILLTAVDSLRAGVGIPTQVGGTGRPLPDQFVLDSFEVAKVEIAIQGYNNAIQTVATDSSKRVVLVDAYAALSNLAANGYVGQGVTLTKDYITGGFFGLDGVHPTSQGYAYIANVFIQAINSHFGSNIPIVAISSVPSSITLGKVSGAEALWTRVHYSDLAQMLKLIQQGK